MGPQDYDDSKWKDGNKKQRPESCCSDQSKCLKATEATVVYKKVIIIYCTCCFGKEQSRIKNPVKHLRRKFSDNFRGNGSSLISWKFY